MATHGLFIALGSSSTQHFEHFALALSTANRGNKEAVTAACELCLHDEGFHLSCDQGEVLVNLYKLAKQPPSRVVHLVFPRIVSGHEACRFLAANCSFEDVILTRQFFGNAFGATTELANGHYILDLSSKQDRFIIQRLMALNNSEAGNGDTPNTKKNAPQMLVTGQNGTPSNFRNVTLNRKPFKLTASFLNSAQVGILRLDYVSMTRPPPGMDPLEDKDMKRLLSLLTADEELLCKGPCEGTAAAVSLVRLVRDQELTASKKAQATAFAAFGVAPTPPESGGVGVGAASSEQAANPNILEQDSEPNKNKNESAKGVGGGDKKSKKGKGKKAKKKQQQQQQQRQGQQEGENGDYGGADGHPDNPPPTNDDADGAPKESESEHADPDYTPARTSRQRRQTEEAIAAQKRAKAEKAAAALRRAKAQREQERQQYAAQLSQFNEVNCLLPTAYCLLLFLFSYSLILLSYNECFFSFVAFCISVLHIS
jgi:hypothetical protein